MESIVTEAGGAMVPEGTKQPKSRMEPQNLVTEWGPCWEGNPERSLPRQAPRRIRPGQFGRFTFSCHDLPVTIECFVTAGGQGHGLALKVMSHPGGKLQGRERV